MNDEIAKEILAELRYIKQLLLYANPPPKVQGPNGGTVMMMTPHPEMAKMWSSIFPTNDSSCSGNDVAPIGGAGNGA